MPDANERILRFLRNYRDPATNQCTPSIRTIAQEVGLSSNYVRQVLRELRAEGKLQTSERFEEDIEAASVRLEVIDDRVVILGQRRLSNLYRVVVLVLAMLCANPTQTVSHDGYYVNFRRRWAFA